MTITQYMIIWVNLDPTVGSEMKKTRPCLVISPDEMNNFLQTIVIAPITSSLKTYPTRVQLLNQKTTGSIALDQIRTIDRKRIIKNIETLQESTIEKVKAVIKETFVD